MQTLVITIILFVVAIILFKVFKPKKVSLEYSYDSEKPIEIEDKKETVINSTPLVVQELKVKRVIRKGTKKKEISAESDSGKEEGGVTQ